jgi:predicted acyl esterase
LKREKESREGTVSYSSTGDGVTFISEPLEKQTEITGPIAARLVVSSSTDDADLFLIFRVFTADLREITFQGRSIRIRRSRRAGCGRRIASSTRNCPRRGGHITPTTRFKS